MAGLPLDDYIKKLQAEQGTQFISRLQTAGVPVESYKRPDGRYAIPVGPPGMAMPGGELPPDPVGGPFQRGLLTVGQDLSSTAALGSQMMGLPQMQDFFEKKADSYSARAQAIPSAVPDFQSIHSPSDLGTYIYERTAENVPLLASLLIPGGAATLVARGLNASAKVARGLGWTTAALVDVGLQTGESAEIAREIKPDEPVDVRVVGYGLGKAALDFLPLFAIAKTVGIAPILEKSFLAELAKKGYLKRVAANIPIIAAVEVPTEAAQEAMNIALERTMKSVEGNLSDEDWNRIWNAAAGAGAVAIGLGPLAGLGRPRIQSTTDEELTPPGIPPTPGEFQIPTTLAPGGGGFPALPAPEGRRGADYYVNTRGEASKDFSVFDSTNIYDPKTGELKITGEELRSALIESSQKLAYDPTTDNIIGRVYDRTWRTVGPQWQKQEDGTIKLGEDAQIVPAGPQGYEVWAPGGPLGTFPDLQSAMRRGEEYAWERRPKVSIDAEGNSVLSTPIPGERIAADAARNDRVQTATGQTVIALEEARTRADRRPDSYQEIPKDREAVVLAQMDQGLQRLIEQRSEVLADKDLYKNDGALSARGQKQLDAVEGRIEKYAASLGIPNPIGSLREHTVTGNVEEQLGEIAQAEEAERSRIKYKNLSKAESALFQKLEEKEILEGLSAAEWGRLEQLQSKIAGTEAVYRKPTKDELEEIQKDLNDVQQIMLEESARVKKEGQGVTASLDEEGAYRFQRSGNTIAMPKFEVKALGNGYLISAQGKPVAVVRVQETGDYSVSLLAADVQGLITARPRGSNLQVTSSSIGKDFRGQGLGTALYEAAAMEAARRGGNLVSDSQVSEQARRAYEGLERRGYEVTQDPNAVQRPGRIETLGEGGVFTVKSLRDAVRLIRKSVLTPQFQGQFAELRTRYKPMGLKAVIDSIASIYDNLQIKPKLRFVWMRDLGVEERKIAEYSSAYVTLNRAGEVTMVLDNLFSRTQAQLAFVHEVLLHYGIRAYFNPKEMQAILKEILAYRTKEIRANAEARGELNQFDSKAGTGLFLNLRDAEEFLAAKMEEAWIRWNAGDKNWMRDSLWEKPAERTFVEKVIAFFRRVFRRVGLRVGPDKWTDPEVASMLKDIAMFMSGKMTGRNTVGVDAHWRTGVMKKTIGSANLAEAIPNMNSWSQVWGAKFATMFLTPIQFAEKYNLPGVARYLSNVQLWWARKRNLTIDSVLIAQDWQKFPKREMNKFASAVFQISIKSDEEGRRLTDEETAQIFRTEGVGAGIAALYPRLDKSFQDMLTKLKDALEFNALMEHTRDEAKARELHKLWKEQDHAAFFSRSKEVLGNLEVGGRLTEIDSEMNQLASRNYFPRMRFGRYGIYIRAKEDITLDGRDFRGPRRNEDGSEARGQVVYFETFERYADRDERAKELVKEFPTRLYNVGYGIVSDAEFTFLGMPPALYEALRGKLNLDEKQTELLKELYFTRSPGRAFLKHLTKRKGIRGFSMDALRTYATYMMNAANHVARVEYHREMGDALTEVRAAGSEMGDVAGITRDYFAHHYDYIMNPTNDWASLRAFGFLWYLGFNVKSAVVNLTQVPMVAYPYLASVYGDGRAAGSLTKAYGTVVRLLRGQSVLDDAAQMDYNRAFAEGIIDESFATELAAISEVPVLQRLLPASGSEKLLRDVGYYGSFLFRHAETFNRRVVFFAARELAIQQGLKGEDVYLAARKAVQTTMFEYAKWNRPTFMRGKKSAFFLFWNYLQHLNYLAWGGEGKGSAIRIWALLLLTAGLQGLPFAEDILDLMDLGSTKAKELLGSSDPKTDLRLELRELAQILTDSPDLAMHGLSRYYGLGPLHLLQLLGVPVPGTDTSGSLSAGRVIPGIQQLTQPTRDPDKSFGQAITDGLGPIAGIGYGFWRTLTSTDPDSWKVWERAMPTAARNASQAVRRWHEGEESFRGGGAVATFDPHNAYHRAEVIANSLGFQPSRVSSRYELRSLQEEMKQYWLSRRALVLENYAYAFMSHDPEALADVRDSIRRFNGEAPAPQLKISMETLENSLKQRVRRADLREEGLPPETAFVPLYRRVKALFPELKEELSTSPTEGIERSPRQ